MQEAVYRKIERLTRGEKPRVLDIFAGCGGLSLGFLRAGFQISGAVEIDRDAAATHSLNFHSADDIHAASRDITKLSPDLLAKELRLGPPAEAIDVLVGGPPCQAFARVGRSKLREIDAHPEAFKHDPRAQLYLEYLRYVDAFRPLALLMENVPDVLNHGGQNIAEEICEVLAAKGYRAKYTLLNAAFFGVPQMRERMILLAYRNELDVEVSFPSPTHYLELPQGYHGSRQVALKTAGKSYMEPPPAASSLLPAVTAQDALEDLPPITEHLEGSLKRGARRFDRMVSYTRPTKTAFALEMREWPGFPTRDGLYDHVIRYLPRDWKLFARLNPGDQYPEAHQHAVQMFNEEVERLSLLGQAPEVGAAEWTRLYSHFVPPYDVSKFPNKWRKMESDRPARTLMAHLGKDSYSHIHYDSVQARTISVREAARLQSFPDGFRFCGTMNPAFKQIGNAVPPLFAFRIAEEMKRSFEFSCCPAQEAAE